MEFLFSTQQYKCISKIMISISGDQEWDLLFVLPNLMIDSPFECQQIAIVPFNDSRLKPIKSQNLSSKVLLERFKNQSGYKIKPSEFYPERMGRMLVKAESESLNRQAMKVLSLLGFNQN